MLPVAVHNKHVKPFTAAVIGGGITGLTAAFRLSEDRNCRRVTLYEKSPRLGGYVQSETVPVDGGEVVFEYGPRTMRVPRTFGPVFADLIAGLGLERSLVPTPNTSPAAYNRYIYYPDRVLRLPAPIRGAGLSGNLKNLMSHLFEPETRHLLWRILCEPFKRPPRARSEDESVGEFVSRRLSQRAADNVVSAALHGIYAGDIYKLSARALMAKPYEGEKAHGSVIRSIIADVQAARKRLKPPPAAHVLAGMSARRYKEAHPPLVPLINSTSAFTWEHGLGELVDGLVTALQKSDKVDVITNADVNDIKQEPLTSDLTVTCGQGKSGKGKPLVHNRVIATTPAPALARILSKPPNRKQRAPLDSISSLRAHNYAVTVMVVNLYYSNPDLVPVRGFGYLIPQSVSKAENPDGALGVIFASETSGRQDTAPGTKITVMLGGHLWDDLRESDYPDHDSAVTMATNLLKGHLGITESPTIARSRLQRNAIPQYTVGHAARIAEISRSVRTEFDHRLTLAGNWYGGVGIHDCITQAYLATSLGVGNFKLSTMGGHHPNDMEGGVIIP